MPNADVTHHVRRTVALLALCCLPFPAVAQNVGSAKPTRSVFDGLFADLRGDTTRDIKGVLVMRHGRPVAAAYFNGDGATTLHDIRSATKSITSTLMGIAIDQKLIASVDAPIGTIVHELARSAAGATSLRDLLTMRSGLDSDDSDSLARGNENRLDESRDWLAFAAAVPRKWPPGARYVYSSLSAFQVGAAVERAAHMPLATFAERTLFNPLGITRYSWRRGPRGEGVGQGNLSITLRDMAKIGELFLHEGEFGGKHIVSRAWVRTALSPIVPTGGSVDRYADAYGFMWYAKHYDVGGDSVLVHFASGNGGNKIYIVPQYDLVLAITSSAYGRGYGQRRSEQILLRTLRAVRAHGGNLGSG
jgi:CubicO group peptidase (beta-lactamase class C family)